MFNIEIKLFLDNLTILPKNNIISKLRTNTAKISEVIPVFREERGETTRGRGARDHVPHLTTDYMFL